MSRFAVCLDSCLIFFHHHVDSFASRFHQQACTFVWRLSIVVMDVMCAHMVLCTCERSTTTMPIASAWTCLIASHRRQFMKVYARLPRRFCDRTYAPARMAFYPS